MNPSVFLLCLKIKTVDTKNLFKKFFSSINNRLSTIPISMTLFLLMVLGVRNLSGQAIIAGWDMSGQSSYGTSPLPATFAAVNTTIGQLTKGTGFAIGGTAAGRAWGYGTSTSAATTTSSSTGISNNSFFTFTVKANIGYTLSLNAISTFDYRRSTSGASSGLLQYQINSGSFIDITTVSFSSTSTTGAAIGSTDLSTISALQNLPSSSTVTFRCVLFNGSTGGAWYIFDRANSTANDFVVTGTVSAVSSYTATFDGNGSTSGTMSTQTASTATALTTNTFIRTGYTFAGWNTAANGSGTSYANGASFPFTANTTLYAQWTANTLNVTYNTQSGSAISSVTTTTGGSLSNPGSPTRSGYVFNGWFTASSGGSALSFPYTHGQTSDFTLYAQWTVASSNNCPNGTSVSPNTDQSICQDVSSTSVSITPSYSGGTGTPTVQYQWYYNTAYSNTILGATAVLGATNASFSPPSSSNDVGTRYYFCVAYATDNSCSQTATTQSLASSTVKVDVKAIPAAPTGTASQSYCAGQTVSNLSATGSSIRWYDASSAGTAWSSSSVLSSTNYYATQTVNGCESSSRLAVAATVNSIPSAPTGNTSQVFCSGQTVSNLSATGISIQWYSGSSGGSPLSSSSPLSSTNYYASQTVSGCESSNRLAVAATVNSISTPINIVSLNTICSSFDLAWNAVNCASGYKLDVSDNRDFIENKKYEDFVGFSSAGGTSDVSLSLDNYTFYSGWSGSKVYIDLNQAKLGTASGAGSIITPIIDFSLSGSGSVSFKAKAYGSDASIVQLFISTDNGTTFSQLGSDFTLSTNFVIYSASFVTTSANVKIKIAAKNSANCRFYLDDVYVSGAKFISGYQDLSVSGTTKSVMGLSPNTKYYYRVRSTDGTNTSASSTVDSVTTPALSLTTTGTLSPICYNASNTTSLAYSVSSDNPNSYSIDWNASANTAGLSDQAATAMTSNAGGGSISTISIPSNVASGTYSGIMTLTNAAGCSITKNLSLTINPLPTISLSASPVSAIACQGSSVTLTATAGLNSYAWSSGSSTTNTATFSPTTTTTYTVTGTNSNGCSATASQTVNYYPSNSSVILANSNVSGAIEQCTESDGFTYYANPASPGQYLFGIYKNGNSFTATVDITLDNVNKYKKKTSSNGANQEHASYTLSRYWNVNATGTVGSGVKVRFFIDSSDITALLNARDNDYDTLKNITNPNSSAVKSGFEWFKTVGTPYNPSNWLGNKHSGTIVKLNQDTLASLNGQTYVELSGITSFSGGTGGAAFGPSSNSFFNNGGSVGLPVTWKDVQATAKENGNLVQWATSSEKNTKSFTVEYSYDSKEFFEASKDIIAAGNSAMDKFYEFNHDEEFGEMVYYRIKQIDMDGKIDYSKVVYIKRTSKLPEFRVSIYPVPLNIEVLTLQIQTVQKTNLVVSISDLLGREVYSETVAPSGYTTNHKINLSYLQQGIYNITISNGSNKTTQVLLIGR